MTTISNTKALQQFDDLVDAGELFYTPSKPIILRDDGLDFDLRTIPSFASKPLPSSISTAQSSHRPPPSDGSDIDHSDPAFFVAAIHNTHKLILNKFCVFRPQYLLLTLDPLQRQTERLRKEDVCAAWSALRALNQSDDGEGGGEVAGQVEGGKGGKEQYYAIYNSGIPGGSSRKHKHMQLLPLPSSSDSDLELLPYRGDGRMQQLPITAFFTPLDSAALEAMPEDEAGKRVAEVVERQWCRARDALAEMRRRRRDGGSANEDGTEHEVVEAGADDDDANTPHNVLLTESFVMTIPRVAATLPDNGLAGHVVGCQGVLGSVWCSRAEQVEAWRRVGLKRALRGLGVPGSVIDV